VNATLNALAEPNRLHIVEMLRERPCTVNEIVARLHLGQPLVSKHLRVLREAQLVRARPQAQQRVYQLQAEPLEELDAWLEPFRRLWQDRLEVLDDYLQEMKREQDQGKA
jgi:DNA-binding transcriptional ArsR family regulator